jgi:hypothetical protein
VVDLAKGGYDLATSPETRERAWAAAKKLAAAAKDYAAKAAKDPSKAIRDARDGVNALRSAFDKERLKAEAEGRAAEFWGKVTGRAATEVALLLAPLGAAAKAGKARLLAEAANATRLVGEAEEVAGSTARVAAAMREMAETSTAVLPCGRQVPLPTLSPAELEKLAEKAAARSASAMAEDARLADELVASAKRPSRPGSAHSRGKQALQKKVDNPRKSKYFKDVPKTDEEAENIIRSVLRARDKITKTGTNSNGQTYTDIIDAESGRGIRMVEGMFDTFVNKD